MRRKMGRQLTLLATAGALLCSAGCAESSVIERLSSEGLAQFRGKCVSVIDGDGIKVRVGKKTVDVRIEGIDCPESAQDYYRKAKQFTAELILKRDVTVIGKGIDRHGRLLARVFVNGEDISPKLVGKGLAWHFERYSDDPELARLEEEARNARVGIWSMPNPIPPWEWRQGRRDDTASAGPYHGNVKSLKFHQPNCQYFDCLDCRAVFQSRDEAIRAGYEACKRCKP